MKSVAANKPKYAENKRNLNRSSGASNNEEKIWVKKLLGRNSARAKLRDLSMPYLML